MNPNITLGEVKAHCIEMFERYKDECCENCKFSNLGCCDAPSDWKLDEDTLPNHVDVCDNSPMTVRKLIACLALCNPDYEVHFMGKEINFVVENRGITTTKLNYVNLM